jgi:hypothetical protein
MMERELVARILELAQEEARAERRRRVANRKARRLKMKRLALMDLLDEKAPRMEAEGRKREAVSEIHNLPARENRRKQKEEAERWIAKVTATWTAWKQEEM